MGVGGFTTTLLKVIGVSLFVLSIKCVWQSFAFSGNCNFNSVVVGGEVGVGVGVRNKTVDLWHSIGHRHTAALETFS